MAISRTGGNHAGAGTLVASTTCGMRRYKIIKLGRAAAVVLPLSMLRRLGRSVGDPVCIREFGGGIELSRGPFSRELQSGRRAMKRYANALRMLAE